MNRKYNIDILRIFSAVAIILIHIIRGPLHNATAVDPQLEANLSLVHRLLLWAVPVFFMITGYCLMQKKECSYKYCFKHTGKYIAILFTVGLFYALLELVFAAKTINFTVLKTAIINVIESNLWDHMWFVYAIIGIYLVIPVFHSFFQKSKNNAVTVTLLLFLFTVLLPEIRNIIRVGITFPLGGYLFYVCFGMLMAKYKQNKLLLPLFAVTGIGSGVCLALNPYNQEFEYLSLFVAIMAVSIFGIATLFNAKGNNVILEISNCTWGIYLIHPFFINLIIKLLKIDLLSTYPYVKLALFFVVVSLLSFATTFILRRIPLIKKLF